MNVKNNNDNNKRYDNDDSNCDNNSNYNNGFDKKKIDNIN